MPYSGIESTAQIVVTIPVGEYSLKAFVHTESGGPIAGASVEAVKDSESTKKTTDDQGIADFGTMAGGTYSITVTATNYRTFSGTLTLDRDMTYDVPLRSLTATLLLVAAAGAGALALVGAVIYLSRPR